MKLEHGFTTREEWAEFFNQYYASIRLINQKANELLHTKDGVESWIEKYKECPALQAQHICIRESTDAASYRIFSVLQKFRNRF